VRAVSDFSRRDFLNATATLSGGLILAMTLPGRGGKLNAAEAGAASGAAGTAHRSVSQLNAWLKIARDNSITVIVDRSEMGQGVYTALPMLLAEELEISLDAIQIVAAPVGDAYINPGNGGQVTGTSNSVQDAWDKLRMAGATARTMLISAAAKRWQVDPASCHAERGTVVNAHGKTLTYGELADSPEGIPTNILAHRLRRMEESGLIKAVPYQQRPVRYAYSLTRKGRGLSDVLRAVAQWGHRHIPGTKIMPEFLAGNNPGG